MVRILIDNSIIRNAEFSQTDRVTQTLNWGGQEHQYTLPGYRKRMTRDDQGGWRQGQIECLPIIGRLIRENYISAYMTPEVYFEWMKGRMEHPFANAFKGCHFGDLDPAVDRSYFQQMDLGDFIDKQTFIDFLKLMLGFNPSQIDRLINSPYGQKLPDQQKENLRNIDVFRNLCHGISENHYPDAFHLWTAEVHRLDYFLLIDKKFQNVVRNNKKTDINAQPISPSELLGVMDIVELDATPLEEEVFYTLAGQKIRD